MLLEIPLYAKKKSQVMLDSQNNETFDFFLVSRDNYIFSGSQIGGKLGSETVDGSITIQERKFSQRLH